MEARSSSTSDSLGAKWEPQVPSKKSLSPWHLIGPGLLMAGAAVGVSHLIQSTRAGASFGFQLLPLVLLANLAKYPFFEIGHRYTAATGESLLVGYHRLGPPYLFCFMVMNLFVAMVTTAGVVFVTAALASEVTGYGNLFVSSVAVLFLCVGILYKGNYGGLDRAMRFVIALLLGSTLVTVALAFNQGGAKAWEPSSVSPWSWASLPFLLALMGWMPAPIELSVWQSVWLLQRDRLRGCGTTTQEARLDFNVGYLITVVLAVAFLTLGACVMYGTSGGFPSSGVGIAKQLVHMYTQHLGGWSRPLIAMAALTAMFSTSITVVDAYPRSLSEGWRVMRGKTYESPHWYWIAMAVVAGVATLIVAVFVTSLKLLVDYATIMAFLAAPVFAWLNYKLITSSHTPERDRPGLGFRLLSYFGLTFLVGFFLLFLVSRLT